MLTFHLQYTLFGRVVELVDPVSLIVSDFLRLVLIQTCSTWLTSFLNDFISLSMSNFI